MAKRLVWKIPAIENEAIVVTFDMCSSSAIIDDLTLSGTVKPYTDLLTKLKHHLVSVQGLADFLLYKFIGDGWILLYPPTTDGKKILKQLRSIASYYRETVGPVLLEHLHTPPTVVGLTFGVDVGRVAKITILANKEYIGRPINVSGRLQKAVRETDESEAYKVLMSRPFYKRYLEDTFHGFPVKDAQRRLRNISGGAVLSCKEIDLFAELDDAGEVP